MKPFVINIGRSLGSGGRAVGRLLAERFDMAYYDREILLLAAKESGFCPEVFENCDEKNNFFHTFGNIIPFIGGGDAFYRNELASDNLFRLQSDAIRRAASKGACVFIGRCADYVLRDNPRCVNVFITADLSDRIARVMEAKKCDEEQARRLIEKGDKQRADYYNFYSAGSWGEAATYHLCVNSSRLGIEETARLIGDYALRYLQE